MSKTVEPNHPLVEMLARKLSGIEGVPPKEAKKMVGRAMTSAEKWARKLQAELDKERIASKKLQIEINRRNEEFKEHNY